MRKPLQHYLAARPCGLQEPEPVFSYFSSSFFFFCFPPPLCYMASGRLWFARLTFLAAGAAVPEVLCSWQPRHLSGPQLGARPAPLPTPLPPHPPSTPSTRPLCVPTEIQAFAFPLGSTGAVNQQGDFIKTGCRSFMGTWFRLFAPTPNPPRHRHHPPPPHSFTRCCLQPPII